MFESRPTLSTIGFHSEVTLKTLDPRTRRWTVIASGLLCGAMAMVVLFTNRGAFYSPLAVVVMGAVGLAGFGEFVRVARDRRHFRPHAPRTMNRGCDPES